MASNTRLRSWLPAHGRRDERCLDAEQVALFIADGGWSAAGVDDAAILAVVRIDDQVKLATVELRLDDLYYVSTRTANRDLGVPTVTVVDELCGECLAQAWLEPAGAPAADPETLIRPFVAARPSGLSEESDSQG